MTAEVLEHITTEGDRWDMIAWKYYGDATLYEPIIAANPEVQMLPVLPSGIKLLIPVLEEDSAGTITADEDLPPWKR